MTVRIGSAHIDENGAARGGKAGDQNGKELSEQDWYLHSKGWRVLSAKDRHVAEWTALAMRLACANRHIGYDQSQRNTLYAAARDVGFDVSKVVKDCETDCSALVRVCVQYAFSKCGLGITVPDFRTTNEAEVLIATGQFAELKDKAYTTSPDRLTEGMILVTRTQGHTVVVTQGLSRGGPVYVKVRAGEWPVYPMPPEPLTPCGWINGGSEALLYGTSRVNPDFRAVKCEGVKGYVSAKALEEEENGQPPA